MGQPSPIPSPPPSRPRLDPRHAAAWREWLTALATDAEAAMAAAQIYAQLGPEVRDAWLDALEEDSGAITVPRVAIYAPLLAVETDPVRHARMRTAVQAEAHPPSFVLRALRGFSPCGEQVVALVSPLYLEFAQVRSCRMRRGASGFAWVAHEPLMNQADAPRAGTVLDGIRLEATPLKNVAEDLARCVLAERRAGSGVTESLSMWADLFEQPTDEDSVDDSWS